MHDGGFPCTQLAPAKIAPTAAADGIRHDRRGKVASSRGRAGAYCALGTWLAPGFSASDGRTGRATTLPVVMPPLRPVRGLAGTARWLRGAALGPGWGAGKRRTGACRTRRPAGPRRSARPARGSCAASCAHEPGSACRCPAACRPSVAHLLPSEADRELGPPALVPAVGDQPRLQQLTGLAFVRKQVVEVRGDPVLEVAFPVNLQHGAGHGCLL